MFIYAHNPHSQGARALSRAIPARRIRHTRSRFTGQRRPIVINWGCTDLPDWKERCRIINPDHLVARVSNKLAFFEHMHPLAITPPFTTDRDEAASWLGIGRRNRAVLCRTLLSASGGRGITLARTRDELVPAPLYVKYIPKVEEYRLHVFRGEVLDVQRKARRRDVPDDEVNWQIRNLEGGFIYARQNFAAPPHVSVVALQTVAHCELDFGAVDVIWNGEGRHAYVLEANSAPGLEGTTVERYTHAFRSLQV